MHVDRPHRRALRGARLAVALALVAPLCACRRSEPAALTASAGTAAPSPGAPAAPREPPPDMALPAFTRDASLAPAGALVAAFSDALAPALPPALRAALDALDLADTDHGTDRQSAFVALDRAVHTLVPLVLEAAREPRGARSLRAGAPLASRDRLLDAEFELARLSSALERAPAPRPGCTRGECAEADRRTRAAARDVVGLAIRATRALIALELGVHAPPVSLRAPVPLDAAVRAPDASTRDAGDGGDALDGAGDAADAARDDAEVEPALLDYEAVALAVAEAWVAGQRALALARAGRASPRGDDAELPALDALPQAALRAFAEMVVLAARAPVRR